MTVTLRPWSALTVSEQVTLREAYATDPRCLVETCSLEAKVAHFAEWLAEQGVAFSGDDLPERHHP